MKKYASLFMIFLTMFQFYSCTKEISNTPTEPPVAVKNNPKLDFTYLDETRTPIVSKTDKIAMKLDNTEVKNILMMSEKTGENEYTTFITDEKTGYVISFIYKNDSLFPEYINIFDGNDIIFGITTKHRDETEDFDIVWHTGEDVDTFIKIPLKNDIYSYTPYKELDPMGNYQVRSIMTSVKIWTAISNYIDTLPSSKGWGWNSFWKAVTGVFIVVVTIVVSAFLYVTQPVLATVLLSVLLPVGLGLIASDKVPDKKMITIKNRYETKSIKDGDTFVLGYNVIPSLNTNSKLYLSIVTAGKDINEFSIKAGMEEGSPNSYTLINAYFKMFHPDTVYGMINDRYYFIEKVRLNKKQEYQMKIEKINNIEENQKRIYLSFETTDEGVIINDNVAKSFRIYIR